MNTATANDKMLMKLETGEVEIQLFPDVAPGHVKRIKTLAENKEYDGVVFHELLMVLWLKQEMSSLEIQKILMLI